MTIRDLYDRDSAKRERLARIRRQIAAGVYMDDGKLDATAARIAEELSAEPANGTVTKAAVKLADPLPAKLPPPVDTGGHYLDLDEWSARLRKPRRGRGLKLPPKQRFFDDWTPLDCVLLVAFAAICLAWIGV